MSEIIKIMARADVDYFWREGGKRFESFENDAFLRRRMEALVAALEAAGFKIKAKAPPLMLPERPAETVREIAGLALNDAIEISLSSPADERSR